MKIYSKLFLKIGLNVIFDPNDQFSYKTIIIGQNVFIGTGAHFSSSHSNIIIGSNVMFGPCVHIYGGNHIYNIVGKPMNKNEKSHDYRDKNVVIEDDVWIGGNSVLLTGITIGRGAVIGAGSIITKDVVPYSVNAGNPCKLIKMRFTSEEIKIHSQKINSTRC